MLLVDSVQPIPSCFLTAPRLSTICCLDDVVPFDQDGDADWSAEAKTAFADMTDTRPMTMKVGILHRVVASSFNIITIYTR